ncbi:MAG: Trm112 family protein [Hyphomonas sp.]
MTEPEAQPEFVPNGVDPRLLELLICPVTRQPLVYDRAANELISAKARLAYPIRGGIPIMLEEEARDMDVLPDLSGDADESPEGSETGEGT